MIYLECHACGNDTFHAVYGAVQDESSSKMVYACAAAECGERVAVELAQREADA